MTNLSVILEEGGDGLGLAAEALAYFNRHLVLRAEHFTTMVLWVLFAHAHDAFSHSPMLGITSPTKRAGKTRILEVISSVVPNPLFASNATAAGIFRAIERGCSTLLADELDTFLHGKSKLRGILNSGHTRSGAYVLRADGKYSTWAPKAVAMIGSLPETLKDRTINISMMRKLPWERVERFRQDDPVAADLRARLDSWANENLDALSLADPSVPSELNDRQADCWRPLFAVADLLGGDLPQRAREASLLLSSVATREEDSVEAFLGDLAKLFEETKMEKMPSATIVKALLALPESRWTTIDRGRPLGQLYIAKTLRPFGVVPRQWGEVPKAFRRSARGYFLADLVEVFARYQARPEEAIALGTPGTPGAPDFEGPAASGEPPR